VATVLPTIKAIALNLRDPTAVHAVLPHKKVEHRGNKLTLVPHTLQVIRVLKNLGVNIDKLHPIWNNYTRPKVKGKHPLRDDQLTTAEMLSLSPRGYCLSTPRVGKTASTLAALEFVLDEGSPASALIIAPNSCLDTVWTAEAFGLFPHWSTVALTGTRTQRLAKLAQPHKLYVINPDGVKVIAGELGREISSGRIRVVVFDELTYYANRTSDRWKTAKAIIHGAGYVWGLTGTPGGPEHVYGQARLVTPDSVPSSYTAWRDQTMMQQTKFKWVPKVGHEQHIQHALSPAVRFDKKDILDLPPVQYIEYDTEMSPMQAQAYERLRKDFITEISGSQITAANAQAMRVKLLQIASGAVIGDKEHITLDMGQRLEMLETIIRDAEYKVVVFVPFVQVLLALEEALSKTWTVASIYGAVVGTGRTKIFSDFQSQPNPQVLLAHPNTVSFGVELAAADTIVFWGPPASGAFVYQQAVERIQSVQQKSNSPSVIHLASSAVERQLFSNLRKGVNINENIIAQFTQVLQNKVDSFQNTH
jgi:hypothetical protein